MSIIEIKDRIRIEDYIGEFVSLTKSGKYLKACCPFHAEKSPSFMVDTTKQTWRCYGACAEGGDVIAFAMKRHNWSFTEAKQALAERAGITLAQTGADARREDAKREKLRSIVGQLAESYGKIFGSKMATEQRAYMLGRGITQDTLDSWGIGYAPNAHDRATQHMLTLYTETDLIEAGVTAKSEDGHLYDVFRNRIVIPIRDEKGRIVGFGGRAWGDTNAKYLNSPKSPIFEKERILFGLHRAQESIRKSGVVVVVEGYMDAIQAHQAGFTNVVAQMGTAMTEAQIERVKSADKVILALDGDTAGQSAMLRAIPNLLKVKTDIRIAVMPVGQDPDDVIRAGNWQSTIDRAVSCEMYLLDTLSAGITPNSPIADRSKVASKLMDMVKLSQDVVFKQAFIQLVCNRLNLSETAMRETHPPLAVVQGSKPVATPSEPEPLERYVINALLIDEKYYYIAQKAMKDFKQSEFDVQDFTRWSHAWQFAVDGFDTDNACEHLRESLTPQELSMFDYIAPDESEYVNAICQLRIRRLSRDIDQLLALGQAGEARKLMMERGKLT